MTLIGSNPGVLPGPLRRVGDATRRMLGAFQGVAERHAVVVMTVFYVATFASTWILRFANIGRLGLNSDEAVYTGQAATLAQVPGYAEDFSIFRAHPLLYQYTLSIVFRVFGFTEVAGRQLSALFGLATLVVVYLLGSRLAGRTAGLIAAVILGVMPFHIIVARQALLESPMTLFYTAATLTLIRYFDSVEQGTGRLPSWLWALATGTLSGLAFMAKEVAGILLVVVFGAMLIRGTFRITHAVTLMVAFVVTVSPHVLALKLGPASEGGGGLAEYVIWQVARPANHPVTFYVGNSLVYFGLPLLILFVLGLFKLMQGVRLHSDRVTLLVAIVVPVWFFQIWKVKGFHYPVVIAPLVAALVAWLLVDWWRSPNRAVRGATSIVALATIASLIWISAINGPIVDNTHRVGDAGYSGIPGGREAALWLAANAPEGSRMLGIGPSVGNIIRWYSDHQTSALSISPNPLRANPAYEPVRNPDFELRWGLVEYLVYDAYSAARTPHFANRLLDFVERYGGEIVHEEWAPLIGDDGGEYLAPVIRIYRVGPVGIDLSALDEEATR